MKSVIMRRIMAVLMAVMLLVPMAAQADDDAKYGEITVSDLVVNYMGTELDFTGLDLKLLAGADAQNKSAIAGVALGVPEGNDMALAAELGADEMTLLLGNQLVSIPYDRFGEALSKLGVEGVEEMPDVSAAIGQMWEGLANGDDSFENYLESLNAEEFEELNKLMEDKFGALLEDAVPEEAKFSVDDKEYDGQKVTIALNAEQATELVSTVVKELYGSDAMKSIMDSVFDSMSQLMAAAGEDAIDMTGMYDAIVDNMSKITLPKGLTVTTYVAGEGDDAVMLIAIDRFAIDMTAYLEGMMSTLGEDAEMSEEDMAAAVMDAEYSVELKGIDEDDADEVEYMNVKANMYMADAEEAFMNLNVKFTDKDDKGALTYDIAVMPEGIGETGEPVNMNIAAEWSDGDDSDELKASVNVKEGSGENVAMAIDWKQTEADDATDGSFKLSVSEGDETIDALDVTYHCVSSEGENDSENSDIDFEANVAGMVTVTGKLSIASMPMDADKLMTTGATNVLNLADATDDEIEALMTGVQSAVGMTMMQAMQVPGVASIISMQSGAGAVADAEVVAG